MQQDFGTGHAVWQASAAALQASLGLKFETIYKMLNTRKNQDPTAMLRRIEQAGAWVLAFTDVAYPPAMRQLFDPPIVILGWGQPLVRHERHLAIVGARRMTSYGRQMTDGLLAGLAGTDVVVVSGLAIGVDGEAHRAALANGLTTWAVLGSGFGKLYPQRHRSLALEIVANGGTLLSEYWPDVGPEPHHFPARNRIIAALADSVLVIEADEKSGSLITVDHGLDLGRDIWAVPGNATSRFSRGTNNLLRQGATLIANSADILAEWDWGISSQADSIPEPQLAGCARLVYNLLTDQIIDLDTIVEQSRLTTAEVLAALMELELGGLAESAAAQHYRKTPLNKSL